MPIHVSVVIPVWNPGKYLDRCVESLVNQTMPAGDFEVLFMDDGSTDGTSARLDDLAAHYPHFKVHHLPNSGWPGKPRNIGIERAVGDYVFFMDNDDVLGREGLERMYAIGARNDSDIVIGKVVSDWRGVPHQVYRETRESCTVETAPLFESLTPHKMFRREFLIENEIRYPEGKRRLEDQLIMARAYFPARHVSIVGDYVCYYYLKRDDGKNAGSTRIEPVSYYNNLREVLDVVTANTEPGHFRDAIHRRFYRGEMLGRVSGKAVLRYPPHFRDELLGEIRRLAFEPRFAPAVHAGLPAFLRVRSYLIRSERVDDLLTYTERCNDIHAAAHLSDMTWVGGVLILKVRAWLEYQNRPVQFVRQGDRLYLSPEIAFEVPAVERECTDDFADARVDVTIKNRDTPDEFFLPGKLQLQEIPLDRTDDTQFVRMEWVGTVRLDPATALGGARALTRGVWNPSVRLSTVGLTRETRLGRDRDHSVERRRTPAAIGSPAQIAIPYWTEPYDNLSVDIGEFAKSLKDTLRPGTRERLTRRRAGARFSVSLPIVVHPVRDLAATVRLVERRTGAVVECPLETRHDSRRVELGVTLPRRGGAGSNGIRPGLWDVALTVPEIGWRKPVRYGPVLIVAKRGPMVLRKSANSATSPLALLQRLAWRTGRRAAAGLARRGAAGR